jgi:hypothetical protein
MASGYVLSSSASGVFIIDESKGCILTHLLEKDDGKLTLFQCYEVAVPECLLITLQEFQEWFAAFAITVYL